MDAITREREMTACDDCGNDFYNKDVSPWKYEKSVMLCADCEAQRMEDEE